MTYIDTLYGHESNITCIDVLTRELAVTGSQDKDLRVWKIIDQQCLVFKGPKSSVDCVAMINEDHFVSGGQDGYVYRGHSGAFVSELLYSLVACPIGRSKSGTQGNVDRSASFRRRTVRQQRDRSPGFQVSLPRDTVT
jgi:WD40 repeat protein